MVTPQERERARRAFEDLTRRARHAARKSTEFQRIAEGLLKEKAIVVQEYDARIRQLRAKEEEAFRASVQLGNQADRAAKIAGIR